MTMAWKKGDVVPYDPVGILGGACDPVWFILTTPPQKERGAQAWLERCGVAECWYPQEKAWRFVRHAAPKAKVVRDPITDEIRRKVPYRRLIAPGYVFTLFDREPIWHLLFEQGRGRVSGVVGVKMLDVMGFDGSPLRVPVSMPLPVPKVQMAKMQSVPARLKRMQRLLRTREQIEADAKVPVVGEQVKVTAGPFEDFVVSVRDIKGPMATVVFEIFGRETIAEMETKILERIANAR